jgi:hypothetical protein
MNGSISICMSALLAVFCVDPPTVSGGEQYRVAPSRDLSTGRFVYGTVASYRCLDGRRFEDGRTEKSISCVDNGRWNETQFTCDYNRCESVPVIIHAHANTTSCLKGTQVNYTCDEGFWLTTVVNGQAAVSDWTPLLSTYSVCDGSSWSAVNEQCTVIECQPLNIVHGNLSTADTTCGVTVTVQCDPGYLIDSSCQTVVCSTDGHWEPSNCSTACQPKDCGLAPTVVHGVVTSSEPTTTYGSQVTYGCQSGYYFAYGVFTKSVTCGADGRWTMDGISCIEAHCRPLLTQTVNTTATTSNTVVNVTCPVDMTLADGQTSSVSFCDDLGRWHPNVPDCVGTTQTNKVNVATVEASHSEATGIVVCALLAACVVLMAAVDVVSIGFKCQHPGSRRPLFRRR